MKDNDDAGLRREYGIEFLFAVATRQCFLLLCIDEGRYPVRQQIAELLSQGLSLEWKEKAMSN